MGDFWLALGFLTTLPAPQVPFQPGRLGRAGRWFPLVGLLIGVLLVLSAAIAGLVLPRMVTAVLVVALWAILTGGLHLDGLADCCDGLLVSAPSTRRLEIMHDPRVGAFGVVGLVLLLLLKVATLTAMQEPALALLVAPLWARWLLLVAGRQPFAGSGGLGSTFAEGLTVRNVVVAGLLPALILVIVAWQYWLILPAAAFSLLICLGVIGLARKQIGGVTGDVLGAVVELSEVAMLIVLSVSAP